MYFERAFAEEPESPQFGLRCSLALEMLGRAALSSISPTLLAEPDREHKNLLFALGRAKEKTPPQSISASLVFTLCSNLFDNFSKEDFRAAMALVNRRNAELHSAEDAFDQYPPKVWLPGFYRICRSLAESLGESLEDLFGAEQAGVANEILRETEREVISKVKSAIAAHQRVFEASHQKTRRSQQKAPRPKQQSCLFARHHRVDCPACGSDGLVQGEPFGEEKVTHEDGEIIVRRSVSPRSFSCSACALKLNGYAELSVAGLGGHYSRRKSSTPEEYFGLIDPETADLTPYIENYLDDMRGESEYDNE